MEENIKISELPECTHVNEYCCLPIVSEGATKRITYGTLAGLLNDDIEPTWDKVKNKPQVYTPEEHTHEMSDVSGLDIALEDKQEKLHAGANIKISSNNVISAEVPVNEFNDLMNNQLPYEVEGTNLNITDSASMKIKDFKVKGNCYQLQTTGKNIVPTNFSDWESGQYAFEDGTKQNNVSRIRTKFLIPVIPGETYLFNTFSDYNFVIRSYDINKNFLESIGGVSNTNKITFQNNTYYLGITIYNPNFTSAINYEPLFADGTIKPFICLDSEINKNYEPYTGGIASPNPDYPQEIKVVTGENVINIYDNEILNLEIGTILSSNGTNSADNTRLRCIDYVEYKGQNILILKGNDIVNKCIIFCYDKNKNYLGRTSDGWQNIPYNFEVLSNTAYIRICVRKDNNEVISLSDVEETRICKEIKNYNLSLGDIELAKIGDAQDSITYEDGKWWLNKMINKIVYDGTYGMYNNNSYSIPYLYIDKNTLGHFEDWDSDICLMTSYKRINAVSQLANGVFTSNFQRNYFLIFDERFTDLATAKSLLTGEVFYVKLSTPTKEEITDQNLIEQLELLLKARTYKNVTNVTTSCEEDNIEPNVNIIYYRDLETVINNLSYGLVAMGGE